MSKYKIQKQYIFSSKSYAEILQYLSTNPALNLSQIHDQKQNTALHQAAYSSNDARLLKKYLEYMQSYYGKHQRNDPKGKFHQFVNAANVDGITALHFAAYRGNFKAIQVLSLFGADYGRRTKSGQNILHMAAQGGAVQSFIYFQSLIDINSQDSKNSTPLHWSCYMNNQSIVTFLLAQPNLQKNIQDNAGQTGLHIATTYGHTKLVKKLLRAGADPKIKNYRGDDCLKIARDNQFKNIQKILDWEFGCLDWVKMYLNLKTVYRPQTRSLQKPLLFLLLLLLSLSLRFLLLQYPPNTNYLLFLQCPLQCILILTYLSLIQKPKYKSPQKYIDFLHAGIDMKRVCLACVVIKPRRAVHCQVCGRCVGRYDHHCYWINNCVGIENFIRFLVFIILFQCLLFFLLFSSISTLICTFTSTPTPITPRTSLHPFPTIYSIIIGMFCLIFSIPMIALIYVHINNIFLNKTTYQRYNRDKISTLTESSSHLIDDKGDGEGDGKGDEAGGRDGADGCRWGNAVRMCLEKEGVEGVQSGIVHQ